MSDQSHEHIELARVSIDLSGETARATVVGEIDMSNADDVYRQLATAGIGARVLTVDLSDLSFIDSAGIAGLDRLNRDLAGGPTRLRIEAAPDSVAGRTLAMAGMDQVLPVSPRDPGHEAGPP